MTVCEGATFLTKRCISSHALWHLGLVDEGLDRGVAALGRARDREDIDPFTLAFTQSYSARLHLLRGEIDEAKRVAEANVRLAEEQGFGYWRSLAELEHAYAPAAGAS